jgi:hypothetical protein
MQQKKKKADYIPHIYCVLFWEVQILLLLANFVNSSKVITMITGVLWFYSFPLWCSYKECNPEREREMDLRLNFCWRFDPLAIHCQRNEMECKIKKNQTTLLPWEAEGTSYFPPPKKNKLNS